MKKLILAAAFVLAAFSGVGIAAADPPTPHSGDPNLCESNPAYHRAHDQDNTDKQCATTKLGDYGGGGGPAKPEEPEEETPAP